jgi:hypothetical protein
MQQQLVKNMPACKGLARLAPCVAGATLMPAYATAFAALSTVAAAGFDWKARLELQGDCP